jgi:hypothetical protein
MDCRILPRHAMARLSTADVAAASSEIQHLAIYRELAVLDTKVDRSIDYK